jgi:tRNA pseudouridine38-40 synthase
MPTYKLVIAYDGTGYNGWQDQPGLPTIEGLFKRRLYQIFRKEIPFTGASRTDAGVHAYGQVARMSLDVSMTSNQVKRLLNNSLPAGISVRTVEEVPDTFHPRIGVDEKVYYYHFFTEQPLPFFSRYGIYVPRLDLDKFKEVLTVFKGTHDFRSFVTGDQGRTTVRTITEIELLYNKKFDAYQVRVAGPSFLTHMIRRIVGASFHVATTDLSKEVLVHALEKKDPAHNLFVAPAQGLLLQSISYKNP